MLEHCLEDAKNGNCRAQVVKRVEKDLFEKYKDENLDVKPKELELRGGAYYSDAACNLISSIYNDKHDIQVVDTLNRGAISNLPDDIVVEVSSIITKDGPIPISVGELPLQTLGLVQQLKALEILTTNDQHIKQWYSGKVTSQKDHINRKETGKIFSFLLLFC